MKWQQATLSYIDSLAGTRLKVILNTGLLQNFFLASPPLPLTDGYIVFFNPSPVRISRTLSARGEGEVLFFSCNFKQRGLNLIFKTCLTPFTTLEMRKALERKCVPQLFMGSLLGMRWSAIGQFFRCP